MLLLYKLLVLGWWGTGHHLPRLANHLAAGRANVAHHAPWPHHLLAGISWWLSWAHPILAANLTLIEHFIT